MTRARDIASRYLGTLKADTISHPSASTAAITLDSAGAMTGSFPYPNRNLLYNGAMQVAQRGTSTASITSGGYFTADRWYSTVSSMGTWTQSVENDGPSGSGLRKSLKMLCTTADASPSAGDILAVLQGLEGQDVQRIAKGTASAQQLTLSFWVKSNVTGTFIAELQDADNGRFVSGSYTISASATWEKKSITFPADTTGVLDNDNAESFDVRFFLGVGSNYSSGTLGTTWHTTTANRAVGQTNLAAATNNYWQITGVQLEVGPVATGFEFKSFGQELRECQRYYQVIGKVTDTPLLMGAAHSASVARGAITFSEMRLAPTTVTFPAMIGLTATNGSAGAATMSAIAVTANSLNYTGTGMSGLTAGNATIFQTQDANGLRLSAEL